MNLYFENVPGLCYVADYLTIEAHDALLAEIDAAVWLHDLKRRVQHYGYKYDYRKRKAGTYLGALPTWAAALAQRLHLDGLMPALADQVVVNEYVPGQGISAHIDCEPCFGDTVVSISLGSPCVMNFTRKDEVVPVLLEPCSVVAFRGEARYKWKHGIAAQKTDTYRGVKFERGRRVSVTFRTMIL